MEENIGKSVLDIIDVEDSYLDTFAPLSFFVLQEYGDCKSNEWGMT